MTDARNIVWHAGDLTRSQRWAALGTRGATLWFTGLSGSGKSTIAAALEARLVASGRFAFRLDGDNIRHGLNKNLGFSPEERAENIRRIAEVAKLFAESGALAITSFISPYRADRALARAIHEADGLAFLEIFVDTPIEVCEKRDPKGLYQKARAGEIKGFTGIHDPYESPEAPELRIDTTTTPVGPAVERIVELLASQQLFFSGSRHAAS
jgi:adenylylsulfate kinase